MTEITQADRDAAAEAFFCKPLLNEKYNDDRRVRAFARHREQAAAEERAKIVAWLRDAGSVSLSYGLLGRDLSAILEGVADAIEAGDHETFTRSSDT
jgi:uncharacterized protein YbjT (DUF2867 family)